MRRFRIVWLMALVAVAAIDLGAFRACYYWTDDAARSNQLQVLFMGAVPMAHVLVAALAVALRHRGSRPFLLGFGVLGLAAWAVFIALAAFHCHTVVRPYLFRFHRPVIDAVVGGGLHIPDLAQIPILMLSAMVILGWWQLALALAGGFVSRAMWRGETQS